MGEATGSHISPSEAGLQPWDPGAGGLREPGTAGNKATAEAQAAKLPLLLPHSILLVYPSVHPSFSLSAGLRVT